MSKNSQISTNSGFHLKRSAIFHEFWGEDQKNGLRPQLYVNFYELWGEATKKNMFIAKSPKKLFLLTNSRMTSNI